MERSFQGLRLLFAMLTFHIIVAMLLYASGRFEPPELIINFEVIPYNTGGAWYDQLINFLKFIGNLLYGILMVVWSIMNFVVWMFRLIWSSMTFSYLPWPTVRFVLGVLANIPLFYAVIATARELWPLG